MAWEWVAPTATGVVGIVGTTGTVIVAWLGRKHAEQVAQNIFAHNVILAREARLAEFLVEAVETVSRESSAEIDRLRQEEVNPDEINSSLEEIDRISARVHLYCSREMNEAYLHWHTVITMFRFKTNRIEDEDSLYRDLTLLTEAQAKFNILARKELKEYSGR